jgi:hypothetical protein
MSGALARRVKVLEGRVNESHPDPSLALLAQLEDAQAGQSLEELRARLGWLNSIHGKWPSTWEPPAWWNKPIPDLQGSVFTLGSVYGVEAIQLEEVLHPLPEIRLPRSSDPGFDWRNPNACLRKM